MDSEKKALRRQQQDIRLALAKHPELHQAKSLQIQKLVLADALWQSSQAVVLYHAFNGEVLTDLLLAKAWQQGKSVYLPRCRPDQPGRMDLHQCFGLDNLNPGKYGILEPDPLLPVLGLDNPEHSPARDRNQILIIVPGLAFDRQGYRLGYGGGYYDRLLALGAGRSLGLCFADNLLEQVPRQAWDIPVQGLCTEEELLWLCA